MTATAQVQAPSLLKFYLTFGVQYSHEPHPYWKGAHPDGWVTIEAPNYADARAQAVRHFGQSWSMLYDHLNFNEAENQRRYYPKGALCIITDDGTSLKYWRADGVPAPSVHITPNDPEYYGRDRHEILGIMLRGHLQRNPSPDHDEVLFHAGCAEEGTGLFMEVCERLPVQAYQVNWGERTYCPVCETSIT